jgi:HAD superfamily hydrolase (TIGR01509 family)
MTKLKAVILDVDGTLVDSNDAHAQAWVETFDKHGYQVAFDKVRMLIGKGGDKLLPETIGQEKDSPEGKAISEERTKLFEEKYLPELQAFPGARELLKRLRDDGLKLVVASSANEDELKGLLKVVGGEDLLEEKTSSSDAKNSKPDPDIIQAALAKSDFEPDEVIMLGDTPYDVEAAGKAGVRTVALRCGGWDDPDLKGAIVIYDDPAEILANYEQSVFAQK